MHFPEAETAHEPAETEFLLQSRGESRDFLILFSVASEVSAPLTLGSPREFSQLGISLYQSEGEKASNL